MVLGKDSLVGLLCSFFPILNREEGDRHMSKLGQFVVNFVKAEDGPTAVEYAVMLALIIVVCIGAITTLGGNANKTFTSVGTVIGGS